MIIRWTTPAPEELVSAYEYAAAGNPAAARRITNHIWRTVEVLARHPIAGRKGRIAGTRELVIPGTPFVVDGVGTNGGIWSSVGLVGK